ncbi:MAG: SPASM domain-containing protein, partial [Acidobacteriota bacterium]
YRDTIEAVSMIQYNEPTVDKRFLDQIRLLKDYDLPVALLTNATGLTPKRVDAIIEMGGLSHLSINLSTIDPQRYAEERGGNHVALVLRNLVYMKDLEVASKMEIPVLGTGDDLHRRNFEEISAKFAGSGFEVKYFEIMDRAGNLSVGLRPSGQGSRLCGCDQTGSRPIQWLHVTPQGRCVLCCQDYHEKYVVGDLNTESVEEVLGGEKMARYRRWLHGIEESPEDFICRKCIYARTR